MADGGRKGQGAYSYDIVMKWARFRDLAWRGFGDGLGFCGAGRRAGGMAAWGRGGGRCDGGELRARGGAVLGAGVGADFDGGDAGADRRAAAGPSGRGIAAMDRLMGGGAMGWVAQGGRGEGAGLPELEQAFELGKNPREGGHDEGVHGRGQPDMRLQRRTGGRLVARKGWARFHSPLC